MAWASAWCHTAHARAFQRIDKIIIEGAKSVDQEAIKNRLPYAAEGEFDPELTKQAIQQVYALGVFSQVTLAQESAGDNKINLIVNVEELRIIDSFEFRGARHFDRSTLIEKLHLGKTDHLDEERVARIVHELKKIYIDANYLNVHIAASVEASEDNPNKLKAIFTITEGPQVKIRKVNFDGAHKVPARKLGAFIFTRPQWLLSVTDDSGKIDEIMLEQDKHRLEFFYQDQGYLMAKVTGVDIEEVNERQRDVTFYVKEGDIFKVRYVSVEGDEEFGEDELRSKVVIQEGDLYSRSGIIESINRLKNTLGEKGYIYADVYPQIKPIEDTHQVDITFATEKSNKMFVNNVNIIGNKVTRDKVIRRQITIQEGDLITSKKLNESKTNVEYLSYFERGSVNWKVKKITEELADLELSLQEARTGHLNFNASYGTDKSSAERNMKFGFDIGKANIAGLGFDANGSLYATPKNFQRGDFRIFDPYFLDSNVSVGISAYAKRDDYEQWSYLQTAPVERLWGISGQAGVNLSFIDPKVQFITEIGFERIEYNNDQLIVEGVNAPLLQPIVDRRFITGDINWLSMTLAKDTRNHRVYPNRGYKLEFNSKFVFPFTNNTFSFYKFELEGSWYTPLIGDDSLVLMVHGKASIVDKFKSTKSIPYKELFHMGGQGTVRGFIWGGVGPAWSPTNAPLGAKKALQFNTELIFPLVPDYSMKGHFFYDAGAGWDTPEDGIAQPKLIKRNDFTIRHAVGFGLNLVQPVPAKIDWGYKLDRNRKDGETASEFHLSMNYAW